MPRLLNTSTLRLPTVRQTGATRGVRLSHSQRLVGGRAFFRLMNIRGNSPELDFLDLSNHSQTAYAPGAEAQFSPDGKWIAFTGFGSTAGEDPDVYVGRFPGPGRRIQISNHGGAQPRWRADGKELFYITIDKKLMAVAFDTSHGDPVAGISPCSLPDANRRGEDRTIPICRLPRR